MSVRINPSILAADFVNLGQELQSVANADFIHVDVMDNHFVPNLTFGQQMVSSIQRVTPKPQDVHLMITDVDTWAPEFAKLGAYSVTFHAEATDHPVDLARKIRSLGARAGIAIKPNTPAEAYLGELSEFDQFLVMTVEPGFGGQSFMAEQLAKVELVASQIRHSQLSVWLQVDGGIDDETIKLAAAAGADTFVAGSSVFKHADRAFRIETLRRLALEAAKGHQH